MSPSTGFDDHVPDDRAGALLEAAADVLAVTGPMDPDDVVDRLLVDGHGEEPQTVRALVLGPLGPHRLADGRVCDLASVVDAMVLTHRLTAEEAASGCVATSPDLAPLVLVADQGLGVIGGGNLELVHHDGSPTGDLHGPDGWLEAAEGGDLMAVTVVGHLLSVMIGGESREEPADATIAGLRDTLRELREHGLRHVELPDLVLETRARHPEVLDLPGPPLGELLPRAGLRLDGLSVVEAR